MNKIDKNGLPILPEFLQINLRATFDYDRHSDDGCPLEVDIAEIIDEVEDELKRLLKQ